MTTKGNVKRLALYPRTRTDSLKIPVILLIASHLYDALGVLINAYTLHESICTC